MWIAIYSLEIRELFLYAFSRVRVTPIWAFRGNTGPSPGLGSHTKGVKEICAAYLAAGTTIAALPC